MEEDHLITDLINAERVFAQLLPRLFRGTAAGALAELLQNAQRAGASTVDIATEEFADGTCRVVCADDGRGIAGDAAWARLLRVADSDWPAEVLDAQKPMGVGFYALLAAEGVREVVVASQGGTLALDARRWYGRDDLADGAAYRAGWRARLHPPVEPDRGSFCRIAITADAAFADAIRRALPRHLLEPTPYACVADYGGQYPAAGYGDLLAVRLDGEPVDTALPRALALAEAPVEGTYLGCPARLDLPKQGERCRLVVNWYGQVVIHRWGLPFHAWLHVRSGTPLTPRAPAREGLIEDDRLRAFLAWVADRAFAHAPVCPRAALPVAWVDGLYSLDRARAERECPYVVARRVIPWDGSVSSSDEATDCTERTLLDRAEAATALLVDDVVGLVCAVVGGEETIEPDFGECGVATLAAALDRPVYLPGTGAADRTLYWRVTPGEPDSPWAMRGRGEWGVGALGTPPTAWEPVPVGDLPVVLWDRRVSYGFADVAFAAAAPNPVAFLERWAGLFFEADDDADESWDEQRRYYDAGVDAAIRALLPGPAVPRLDLAAVERSLPTKAGRIVRLDFPPRADETLPAVVATTEDGSTHTFAMYGN